jgi:DNA topoisomerase 2-associated protein PAT1
MHFAAQQSRIAAKRQQELQLQEVELQQKQQQFQRLQQHAQQQQQLQQQIQQQQQQQQQLQQQSFHLQKRTPPPRILPMSQSPRFHDHQRQILLLQQQQEQQQQLRLKELQEQLRLEEIERMLRAQQIAQINQGPSHHLPQRQPSRPTLAELQSAQIMQRRQHSPAFGDVSSQLPMQQAMSHHPQNIQLQQRLLSEMAQMEFMREMQGATQADQEALRMEAMRKIMEAERMEEKRRRKAAKIAHMVNLFLMMYQVSLTVCSQSRYNDLMTQSDKDFITRIQVSQLVTQDPYAEDFYAQVYGAITRSRLGLQSQDERVLKFGSSGGVGLGAPQKSSGRRPNAMQRMEAQVERIVSNARIREKEKGLHCASSNFPDLDEAHDRAFRSITQSPGRLG